MMEKQTIAIANQYRRRDAFDSLLMPVYHTAAYEFDSADAMVEAFCRRTDIPDYSRVMNPTVTAFEDKVKALTGATNVTALNSGMAAISNALFALAKSGSNILTSRHLFGNSYSLITKTFSRFGVEARLCDLTNVDEVAKSIDQNTCCIYLEIITNPQMEVADLRALSDVAHSAGIPLVCDTTMIPFTEFSSKDLGVDIEVVSSTKYLSGGATSLGGLIIDYGNVDGFAKRMHDEMLMNFGAYMTPHAAYMQTLGLETLNARYAVQSSNALYLAQHLKGYPAIKSVNYVALEDNPYHQIAKRQFGPTGGAMLTIDLADREACFRFIDNLKLIHRATNLFDSRSLAIHPASTIFGLFSPEERAEMDVLDTTIRLSIGLESASDLYADIIQALEK